MKIENFDARNSSLSDFSMDECPQKNIANEVKRTGIVPFKKQNSKRLESNENLKNLRKFASKENQG